MFRKRDAICKNRIQRVRINFPLYVTSNYRARDNFTCVCNECYSIWIYSGNLRYRYKRITRRETKDISRLSKFDKQWEREFVPYWKITIKNKFVEIIIFLKITPCWTSKKEQKEMLKKQRPNYNGFYFGRANLTKYNITDLHIPCFF